MNDVNSAAIILQKIFGIILIILCPFMLLAIIVGGMKARGTPEELSLGNWLLGISFALMGLLAGLYICRNQFGWFKRK